jgi:hypothetical protein
LIETADNEEIITNTTLSRCRRFKCHEWTEIIEESDDEEQTSYRAIDDLHLYRELDEKWIYCEAKCLQTEFTSKSFMTKRTKTSEVFGIVWITLKTFSSRQTLLTMINVSIVDKTVDTIMVVLANSDNFHDKNRKVECHFDRCNDI